MYMRKAAIAAMKKKALIGIVLALVGLSLAYIKPTEIKTDLMKVQNVATYEIYRNYTVERVNGKIEAVYVDTDVYAVDTILGNSEVDHCDYVKSGGMDDTLDNGHNCMLQDTIEMFRFLESVGY